MKSKPFNHMQFKKFADQESTIAEDQFISHQDMAEQVLQRFEAWRTKEEPVIHYPLTHKGVYVVDANNKHIARCASPKLANAMCAELMKGRVADDEDFAAEEDEE